MKKLFILLIVSLCINVCHAQKNNSDPLYSNGKTKTSLKKENKEKRKNRGKKLSLPPRFHTEHHLHTAMEKDILL